MVRFAEEIGRIAGTSAGPDAAEEKNGATRPVSQRRPSSGPTTEKGRRTRDALVKGAREVFEARGFVEARISDITRAAGVAHGTFYTYFESKEAIFQEVANALVGQMFAASRIPPGVSKDPVARIEAANRRYLEAYERNARMMMVVDEVAASDDYFAILRRDMRKIFVDRAARGIRRLQAQGLAYRELDADYTANALGAMVEQFAYLWLALGEPFEKERSISTLTQLWANAIGLRALPQSDGQAD